MIVHTTYTNDLITLPLNNTLYLNNTYNNVSKMSTGMITLFCILPIFSIVAIIIFIIWFIRKKKCRKIGHNKKHVTYSKV